MDIEFYFGFDDPYFFSKTVTTKQEQTKGYSVPTLEDLRTDVIKLLVAEHDFTFEEAEESVNESVEEKPDFWNENADANDLAKSLASDDDE
jgi:hypothetical protein